ncbi:hypothetical protein HPB51_003719 [Rhipicephalus microplus]|uniref:Transposable element P transposase-like RNase H domain-containing protein n=1 Tax=Rhipicephalus microplus TaxID=6941 RepID=A0A9J6E5L4_RHIMP|nr:hypothetical protein HPB51_003719 [Rhipicephalus microplus]
MFGPTVDGQGDRREEGSRNIKTGDRVLEESSVVCERHFQTRFIQRTFQTIINGKIIEIPRDQPLLSKDAIPTIFPDAPKYFSKALPKKRKDRNLSGQILPKAKPIRRENNTVADVASNYVNRESSVDNIPEQECQRLLNDVDRDGAIDKAPEHECQGLSFSKLTIPSAWSEIFLPCVGDSFLYAELEADAVEHNKVALQRLIQIKKQAGESAATTEVLFRGKKWRQEELVTREEVELLINNVSKLTLCPGVGMKPLAGKYSSFNEEFFSKNCTLVVADALGVCAHCSIEGFVDPGQLKTEGPGKELADHGLVVVFQPFTGKWMQILGIFVAKGNVKANILVKIILECTLFCENAGLHVDGVTCAGASWNRSMWRIFGVQDAVVEGSGNLDHLGFFNVHPNLSTRAYNISASIGNAAAAAGIRTRALRVSCRVP